MKVGEICSFCLSTGDVMSTDLLVLKEGADVADALERMGRRAVRRAPLVSTGGELAGMRSQDSSVASPRGSESGRNRGEKT